jgi:hypothetical protein
MTKNCSIWFLDEEDMGFETKEHLKFSKLLRLNIIVLSFLSYVLFFIPLLLGANMLIGAISAPLGDFLKGIFLKFFWICFSKISFKVLKKFFVLFC